MWRKGGREGSGVKWREEKKDTEPFGSERYENLLDPKILKPFV
jgi:hypothetical protein